jgi:hypothetical protein
MRNLLLILFFAIGLIVHAEQFTVFEQGGYFGIKDQTGNVTVPAVYEKLGWSDGSSKVYNGVIGFKQKNLWGLITVRNKALTGQKFYTINPISSNHFKAAIKGRFSNHLFHGVLDEKGKTIISFNYFSIEPLGANWLVSVFDGKNQLYGVVSFENEIIVPPSYASIEERNGLLLCQRPGQKIDLFSSRGLTLELGLDSLTYNKGWSVFRDGYAGFLSSEGQTVYDFEYKSIETKSEQPKAIPFPEWTIYRSDSVVLKWKCDSLVLSKNGLFLAYLNGAHHLLLRNSTLLSNHELLLKEVSNNYFVVQNSKTRKWSLLSDEAVEMFNGYDSIHSNGQFYAVKNSDDWDLLDIKGLRKNRFTLQALRKGFDGQFIGKRNDHWGIIDPTSEHNTTYKYDSIITLESSYLVSYLNRWGAMNQEESWIIRPEFNEIFQMGGFLIARKGRAYTIFKQGEALLRTASVPIEELHEYMLLRNEGLYGIMNEYGEMIVYPEYDSIRVWNDHFELKRDRIVSLISSTGEKVLHQNERYQQVAGFGEGYFLVQKENRWGFVDDMGRLRISNRYDSARVFKEEVASVMLKGKWGFIDKSENLIIQPYYNEASDFKNGLAIVRIAEKSGLIDKNGNEVLELIWKSVHRLHTGNYLVEDINGQFGLVNEKGNFILRPAFDHLSDYGNQVLVSKKNAWGILDYSGQQIFKINHEEVKVVSDFTMIKN